MSTFRSPAILGQQVPDLSTTVIVRIVGSNEPSTLRIVPMPGTKGETGATGPAGAQGPQGPAGDISSVTFGGGLSYNAGTNTLTITGIDGGVI